MVFDNNRRGIIFNIQRFSIHDGPGIRSVLFLKGCPLTCKWCSNPESQKKNPEIMFKSEICINCSICKNACGDNAIINGSNKYKIIKERCSLCLKCVEQCPSKALQVAGKYLTVSQTIKELLKDEIFYSRSGGGITLSGGEPLYQWEFSLDLLKACKKEGLNTAIETSGFGKWHVLEKIIGELDYLLYDIKSIDRKMHIKYTSVDNKVILDNAQKASKTGVNMILRFLIIPGINDTAEYKKQVIEFLRNINAKEAHLLAYHGLGVSKYKSLGMEYELSGIKEMDGKFLLNFKSEIEANNITVKIGG